MASSDTASDTAKFQIARASITSHLLMLVHSSSYNMALSVLVPCSSSYLAKTLAEMTKINRKIGFIEFKSKWPNCIICRLQFLRSQRYFDEGTKVFKLNRFVLARLQRIEIQVLQLKLTSIKSVTNLKLCQDKSHRAMAKFVRAEFKEHLNKIQRNERTKTK